MKIKQIKAFTLIELLVIIVVLAVIAGLAIPNYNRTIDRAYWQEAFENLVTVFGAQQIYFAKNNRYAPNADSVSTNWPDVEEELDIEIIDDFNIIYNCIDTGADNTFTCTATHAGPNGTWTITVNQGNLGGGNPGCTANCPWDDLQEL